jgi:DNA helicase-2/ATP-dependent DNA helicase PcrA
MQRCFIFYAQERMRFGETARAIPSRFLEEIERSGATEHITSFGTKPRTRSHFDEDFERPSTSHLFANSPVVNGRTFTRKRRERTVGGRSEYAQTEEAVDGRSMLGRGTRVFHETFGEGRIIEVAGTGDKAKATVEFPKFGRKNLMLKFANLKVL